MTMSDRNLTDRQAREAALQAVYQVAIEPTDIVVYRSQGRVLLVGSAERCIPAARQLATRMHCTVLLDGEGTAMDISDLSVFFRGQRSLTLSGYLGAFDARLETTGTEPIDLALAALPKDQHFDLIVDFGDRPEFAQAMPPVGYHHLPPEAKPALIEQLLDELPDQIGEFEKPRYFHYNPDICAHGQKGLTGCRRCLDACPAGAITSLVSKIAVDPYLCQGGGSCATGCPTGAIGYRYPRLSDLLDRLRTLLKHYRQHGGESPRLLFYPDRCEPDWQQWPGYLLPVALDDIGVVGMDVWLSALAYGAVSVQLWLPDDTPDQVRATTGEQLAVCQAIMTGMGYPETALSITDHPPTELEPMPAIKPAGFAGQDDKRTIIYLALDHLLAQAPEPRHSVPLPTSAPFGNVIVDQQACTLCMACVSVCPPFALNAGGGEPKLTFSEAACVQCGLCERACPEDAIRLEQRLVYPPAERRQRRVLHEEPPFCCIDCGKPFATRAMIETITAKLQGHWMFQDDASQRRLQMCEDCRVRDLTEAELRR